MCRCLMRSACSMNEVGLVDDGFSEVPAEVLWSSKVNPPTSEERGKLLLKASHSEKTDGSLLTSVGMEGGCTKRLWLVRRTPSEWIHNPQLWIRQRLTAEPDEGRALLVLWGKADNRIQRECSESIVICELRLQFGWTTFRFWLTLFSRF
jgi:hypothetical protein